MASRNTTRARDIDRSNTCTLLDAGYGEGQLDFDEHKSRTSAAMSARTLGELESLVTDLQLPKALTDTLAGPDRPAPPRRLTLLVGVAAAAVVATAVTLIALNQDGPDPVPAAAAPVVAPLAPAPNPPAPDKYADVVPTVIAPIDTLTAAGIEQFIIRFRDKFGDTLIYDATLYSDYAGVTRMVPDQPGREQRYSFRGGFDADSVSSHTGDEPPFDLASVDLNALAGHLGGAAESVRVPGGVISHIRMDVDDGDPTVSVYVHNEATDASGDLELRPNGEIVRVSAYSPTG